MSLQYLNIVDEKQNIDVKVPTKASFINGLTTITVVTISATSWNTKTHQVTVSINCTISNATYQIKPQDLVLVGPIDAFITDYEAADIKLINKQIAADNLSVALTFICSTIPTSTIVLLAYFIRPII